MIEVGLTTRLEAEGPETVRFTVMVLSATVTPLPSRVLARLIVDVAVLLPEVTGRLSHVDAACTVNEIEPEPLATLLAPMGVGYVTHAAAGAFESSAKGVPPVADEPTVTVWGGPG